MSSIERPLARDFAEFEVLRFRFTGDGLGASVPLARDNTNLDAEKHKEASRRAKGPARERAQVIAMMDEDVGQWHRRGVHRL